MRHLKHDLHPVDDALLQNKSNKHVLEKLSTRIQKVRDFLTFFKPEITPEIVPITDVYGPTGWDPNIQALVVSKETLSGGDASQHLISFLSISRGTNISSKLQGIGQHIIYPHSSLS